MVVLKIIGKILLVPVWLAVAIVWIVAKILVSIYSFARGIATLGLIALITGTILCYHDWRQVLFLIVIDGGLIAMLFTGTLIEELLRILRTKVGSEILI